MLANEDQVTFWGVFEDILTRAALRIETDLQALLGVQLNSFQEVYCVGRATSPIVSSTTTGGLQGIIFNIHQSQYLVLSISEILFFSPIDQDLHLLIIDLEANAILNEYFFYAQAGENRFPINEKFWPRRNEGSIFIGFENPGVFFFETTAMACHPCKPLSCNELPRVREISGWDNGERTLQTFGLGILYSIECSFERFICWNAPFFKNVLLYAAGVEYVLEMLGSSRLNRFTATKQEEMIKLQNIYENYYVKNLKNITKVLNFCDDCCFHCQPGVEYTYARP